jgi:hypothetical protein
MTGSSGKDRDQNWGVRLYFSDDRPSPLKAHRLLFNIKPEQLYNDAKSGRPPANAYLNSISRICARAKTLCDAVETRFNATVANPTDGIPNGQNNYIEVIELALYSAAEHVDDVDRIAHGLFQDKKKREKDPAYKKYDTAIKDCKKPISIMANRIKHEALRVRSVATEFAFDDKRMWLHGFRLETVKDGMALPDRVAHGNAETISTVTLAWEIVIFLLRCSDALYEFIKSTLDIEDVKPEPCLPFSTLIRGILRLPQYDFDTQGPIKRYPMFIDDQDAPDPAVSGLFGSYQVGWGLYQTAIPLGAVQEAVAERGMGIKLNTQPYCEFVDWINFKTHSM